jgi:hypothetical protein
MKALKIRLSNPLSAVAWAAFLAPLERLGSWAEPALMLATAGLGCVVLYTQPSPWEARATSLKAARAFAVLQLLYVVSFLYSLAFNGLQTGPRDLWDLPRYALWGVCAVYLIRHFDGAAKRAVESAMTASVYLSWAAFQDRAARGYVLNVALCYLLFFSRSPRRALHAAAALLMTAFLADPSCRPATLLIVCAALAVELGPRLERRGLASAGRCGAAVFVLLLALGAAGLRARPLPAAEGIGRAAEAAVYIRRSPLLGWGPAHYERAGRTGNQYLVWLLKGGAVGTFVICAGLLLTGYGLLRAEADAPRMAGAAAFAAAVALMLLSGTFLESFRLFLVTSLIAAGMRASEEAA